jgi:hypothetical protein
VAPGTSDPSALKILTMGARSGKAEIPPSTADGRTLVLAEDFDSHWQASIGGTDLKPVTVDGWAQGFEVPAAGGTVTLSYSSVSRDAWLAAEGLFFLFAVVMALPTGRNSETPATPIGDEYEPARGDLSAARRGRRGVPEPGPAPELEPVYESEAPYETEPVYEAESESEYAGRRRNTGEFPRPGTGEYARPEYDTYGSGEHQRPTEYGQYDSYGRRTTGEYGRPGTGEYQRPGTGEFDQPAVYGPYAAPGTGEHQLPAEEYGGYLRPGSGEYERPDFEGAEGYVPDGYSPEDYGQDGYGQDGYGQQGGYR